MSHIPLHTTRIKITQTRHNATAYMILQHLRRKQVLRHQSISLNRNLLGFWLGLCPLYAVQAAEAACAAIDCKVRFFCDGGGEEDGVLVGFTVADAGVLRHGGWSEGGMMLSLGVVGYRCVSI